MLVPQRPFAPHLEKHKGIARRDVDELSLGIPEGRRHQRDHGRQMIVHDPQRKLLAAFGPDQQVEVVTEVTPFGNFTLSITPIN